jgi:gag-polyprotein putative aspartyl protease
MKLLLIGVSLVALTLAAPAQAGRYMVDQCSPNQNKEKWFLIFDKQQGVVNFSRAGSDSPRYGTYSTIDGASHINVANDTAAPMNMKLRNNHDPAGKPVLEWTSGTENSTMLCEFLYENDYTPANWILPPPAETPSTAAPNYAPPLAETVPNSASTNNGSSSAFVSTLDDGAGGQIVDVTFGTNTIVGMTIDTGASIVSLPQDIADQLVDVGEATVLGTDTVTLADGKIHEQTAIDIGKLTLGGKTLYHIRAVVGATNSKLLGTNVLNKFGKFSIDATNNRLILG